MVRRGVSGRTIASCEKSALCEAANSTLGTSLRKKADWFEESAGVLRHMLETRRGAYLKWLDTGNERERKKLAEMRSVVRRAVRDAKNSWFLRMAREAECGRHIMAAHSSQHPNRGTSHFACFMCKIR